jgi:ABC-type phosphate/phosphonate transport system permease subunit
MPIPSGSGTDSWQDGGVRGFVAFLRANPQALVLLIICIVLGLGTFLAVVFGIASSGSQTTNGYPSDVILGLRGLLG